jgi:hypothetical protein
MPKVHIQNHTGNAATQAATFVESIAAAADSKGNGNGTFDSIGAASEFTSQALNRSDMGMPENLKAVFDDVSGFKINVGGQDVSGETLVMKAVLDGVNAYTAEHGSEPTADMVLAAFHQAHSTTREYRRQIKLDDVSATSGHSDNTSMQPNRAVTAIMGAMSEAIPVANYLPFDIGSNEAKLIVVQHVAGSNAGTFKQNDSLDGLQSGNPYLSSSRTIKLDEDGECRFTSEMEDYETCDQDAAAVPLLAGRTIIYVMGLPVAHEVSFGGATSQLGGSFRIGSTDYNVSGIVKPALGEVAVTFTPALPANTIAHAEGFIDLELRPALTPLVAVQALKYSFFANPWRASTTVSIDSATQFANEVGISPETETALAIRNQFGNERHALVLRQAERLGLWNTGTYQFNWAAFGQQKTRGQIAQDIVAALYPLEQKMANMTMDHGITHLYVDEVMASTFLCCDATVFVPSGIAARPTIYRLGRLLGKYEVYVNPQARKSTDSADVSKIVCVGRSTQAGRNPFVLGDAVAPVAVPIATGQDMNRNAGFYARNFTAVNKHAPSAMGCAILTVTGLTAI